MTSIRSTLGTGVLAAILVLLAACSGDDSEPMANSTSPVSTASVTSTATPAPTAEEAVIRDYGRYWEIYGAALLELDSTALADVMTGPRLERALTEVTNLRQQGRAVRIEVENTPLVVSVNGATAVVLDTYENSSHFVDPVTKAALASPSAPQTIRDSVTLVRVGDVWKVLDTVRSEGPP
ncbi:MAG: hypothetical protein GEU75_13420 [Dehalococcoidia bacterium]|nr:hypothetical protein [Dehalococcoidia bacterium]